MKKRGFLLFVTLALMLAVCVLPVHAEENSNRCGYDAYWKLEDGVLTIYGTGGCYSRPWKDLSYHTVVVESGIISIDSNAFQGAQELVSATLADTVVSISQYAFADCPKLEQVAVGNALEFIGTGAFSNCPALKELNLPDSVLSIYDNAFAGCTGLTAIHLSGRLQQIGKDCFKGSGLTRVEIPGGLVLFGEGVFRECTELEEAVIHGQRSTLPAYLFQNCSKLTAVTLPAGLETIGRNIFEGSGLTTMVIPEGVTVIDDSAFAGCIALESVTLPSSLKRISYGAFQKTGLNYIEFPASLTDIGNNAFAKSALTELIIPDTIIYVGSHAFSDCVQLVELNLSQSEATYYSNDTFSGCSALTQVTIPAALTILPNRMFSGTGLTQVEIPATVTRFDSGVFSYCQDLHTVIFQNSGRETALDLGSSTFEGCISLKEITLPDELTVLGNSMFSKSGLERIVIPEGINTLSPYVFFECTNLTSVTLPQSLSVISCSAFDGCTGLTQIDLPEGLTTIEFSAFYNTGLTSIVIPEGVKSLASNTFANCAELQDVYLPSGLTGLESDTFFKAPNVVLHCTEGTMAHLLALSTGLPLELLPPPENAVYYPVGLTMSQNGTAAISADSAFPGQIVQIYAEPDEGCFLYSLVVYYDSERELELYLTQIDEQNYYFIMPDCAVEVAISFFNPSNPFVDVSETDYYYVPVLWAYNAQITAGVDATHFAPSNGCTRGQVVTFLWRTMGCPEPEGTANPFTDVKETDYFYKAVLWAVENGITAGMSADTFAPNAICTRGQVVTFLWRLAGEPFPIYYYNPFNDVAEGEYFHHAVLWAVECGITAGTGEGTFSPNQNCTRGQIVTFLYRALGGQ